MKFGNDTLLGHHYQEELIKAQRPGDVGGIFLRTAGNATNTVGAMCRSGKWSEIVIHLAPFDNSHQYPIKQLLPQMLQDAKVLNLLQKKYPNTILMLSPFCEHNHSRKEMNPVFDALYKIMNGNAFVNTIWKGEVIPDIITEVHLTNSKSFPKKPKGQYTISFDGFGGDGSGDFTDVDVESIILHYSDARHIRAWNFRMNGKFGHLDTTPLDQRKTWPSVKYLKGHRATLKAREGQITWPKNTLYKPFADDHGSEPKDNLAMVIIPVDASAVNVYDSKDKVIDVMSRFKPDHTGEPKGPRYYSKRYAYEIGDIAEKNTGSRLIRVGNSRSTDADLRSNNFR